MTRAETYRRAADSYAARAALHPARSEARARLLALASLYRARSLAAEMRQGRAA